MKQAIVQVRGTNGSGKTTTARQYLDQLPNTPVHLEGKTKRDGTPKISHYVIDVPNLERPVALIGEYSNTCGGLDTVSTKEEVEARVRHALADGCHILMEGLLLSKTGPGGYLPPIMRELGQYVNLYLDTDVEECVRRVKQRRLEAGNEKPFNETNLRAAHKQVGQAFGNMEREGYENYWVSNEEVGKAIYFFLKRAES